MTSDSNNSAKSDGIVLIDSSPDSLTVSWTEPTAAKPSTTTRYILQYRMATSSDDDFETLSDKLSSPQARKRNLSDPQGVGFLFRVAAVTGDNEQGAWMTHAKPFLLLSESAQGRRMPAPQVSPAYTNLTARISWAGPSARGAECTYELQMRENRGGCAWETIASSLSRTQVNKKNLVFRNGYQFRVRPVVLSKNKDDNKDDDDGDIPFSPPSEPHVAQGLSEGLKRVLEQHLEEAKLLPKPNSPPAPLADVLGGKEFVLLYASAHWCGPCRQFTPQLVQWYNNILLRDGTTPVQVVFLSADHDERSFQQYYGSMPWTAVPYEDDGREALMGYLRVQGIPRLAVLDGRTGRIIEDNAVGKPLDISRWRTLAAATSGES